MLGGLAPERPRRLGQMDRERQPRL